MAALTKVEAARRASGMTIEDAASACGVSSATYANREKSDFDQFRLSELQGLYSSLNEISQPILKEAVADIFLP